MIHEADGPLAGAAGACVELPGVTQQNLGLPIDSPGDPVWLVQVDGRDRANAIAKCFEPFAKGVSVSERER